MNTSNLYTYTLYTGLKIRNYVKKNPNTLLSKTLIRRYWKYEDDLGFSLCCLNDNKEYYIFDYDNGYYDSVLEIPIEQMTYKVLRGTKYYEQWIKLAKEITEEK